MSQPFYELSHIAANVCAEGREHEMNVRLLPHPSPREGCAPPLDVGTVSFHHP